MNELVSFILCVKSCRLEESWAKLETVQNTLYTGILYIYWYNPAGTLDYYIRKRKEIL